VVDSLAYNRRRVLGLPLLFFAPPQTISEADLEFFERRVRPLLVEHCAECHSSAKKRPKGGLLLDSRAGWVRGGDSGAAIVPGDVEASRLVRAIRYSDPELEMPPDGKLPAEAITTLEEWVRRGAPDPREGGASRADVAASTPHWAFQPLGDPLPPAVKDERWVRNDIDRFVLARLESEGLTPAPEADRRTLLRRASFDLLGLPPTSEELGNFANDPASDAWEREVERLLASPHYGERWGRRWLDLARYADSNGLDENLAMASAWRYRDWVVRAFNNDLPYDRFVTAQLAGDLLPEPADEQELHDQLTATGFLVLGPKMLAEQDKVKLALDVVDEQLDVAGQAFLGLTLGCARCHDHKYDPLTQRDYTALAGIFRSTSTMANLNFVSSPRQRELAPRARIAERTAALAAAQEAKELLGKTSASAEEALRSGWRADLARYLLSARDAAKETVWLAAEESSRGNLFVDRKTYGTARVPLARTNSDGLQFVEYDLAFPAAASLRLDVRYAAEESRPVRVLWNGNEVSKEALRDVTGGWRPDALAWTSVALIEAQPGRNVVRFERDGAMPHLAELLFAPTATLASADAFLASSWAAGLVPDVVRNWVGVLERATRFPDPAFGLFARFAALPDEGFELNAARLSAELREALASGAWQANALVVQLLEGLPPASARELALRTQTLFATIDQAWRALRASPAGNEKMRLEDDIQEELRLALDGRAGPFALPATGMEALLSANTQSVLSTLRTRIAELDKAVPPAFEQALGVAEAEQMVALPIHVRGSHLNLGPEPIPRGFPAVLTALEPAPPIPGEASGRLEFARWLTSPTHPLTSRVMVNRVWQGHFGQGLVRTPSNFGRRGATPTHPELLDWLARRFVRDGWSVKALHRRILTSATYRQASTTSAETWTRDPENLWLARANRQRLDAESLRDALLADSGTLDRTLGGTLLETKDGDYVTNDQSTDRGRYGSTRRSLYLPIVRNAMYDFFATFDYRDPSLPIDQRSSTTTPAQALWLLNSPLVLDAARHVAEELATLAPEPAARVQMLYRRVLQRAPSERELALALAFVSRPAAEPTAGAVEAAAPADPARAWRGLVQTLFLSSEFLYLD
jgi:hypothetical protein